MYSAVATVRPRLDSPPRRVCHPQFVVIAISLSRGRCLDATVRWVAEKYRNRVTCREVDGLRDRLGTGEQVGLLISDPRAEKQLSLKLAIVEKELE